MDDTKVVVNNLGEVLGQNLEDGEVVEEYVGKPATATGENYGSTMVALEIKLRKRNGERRSLYSFCKMLPKEEAIRVAFNCKVTFIKEIMMYQDAVPAMLQLQKENNVPEEDFVTRIFPQCYGARRGQGKEVDEDAVILMEDLRKKGFVLADRLTGADFEHTKLVMKKLAMFHALPVALKIKKNEVFRDAIKETAKFFVFNEDDPNRRDFETNMVKIFEANMKKIPELRGVDFQRVLDACLKSFEETLPPIREPFSTIMHNDLWINNMLFKHKNGNPEEIAFVDFQVTHHNSPFKDIIFFLFSSVHPETRQKHLDEFIEIYHASFCHCLEQVGVDTTPFSLTAAWDEINALAATELQHVLGMLRIITADPKMVKQYPATFFLREDLGGDVYLEKMKHVVLEFVERKWI